MKVRKTPKAWGKQDIYIKREKVGYIQLVSYMTGNAKPHIEYYIKPEYRNQGIMSRELPKYLKFHKEYNPQLIAVVKPDNVASVRLLQKNGFVKITTMNDSDCYIRDAKHTPEMVKKMLEMQRKALRVDG